MAIDISCPQCQSAYKVRSDLVGKKVRCKQCGTPIPVVAGALSAAAPPAIVLSGPPPAPSVPPPPVPMKVVRPDPLLDPDVLSGKSAPPPPPTFRTARPPSDGPDLRFRDDIEEERYRGPARPASAPASPAAGDTAVAEALPGFTGKTSPSGSRAGRSAGQKSSVLTPPLVVPAGSDKGPAKRCPDCGAPQKMGELVCRHCGFNPVTGKRAAERLEEQEAGIPAPPLTRARRPHAWMYGPTDWDSADTFALNLAIFGIGACILPLFGLQWRPLALMGAYAAWVGLFLGLGGSALYSMRQRFGLGALTGMLALAAFGVSMRFSPPPEEEKTVAGDQGTRTAVATSGAPSNTSNAQAATLPPPDEVLTILAGPPSNADPVTWHIRYLDHSDPRVRHKCAIWLAEKTPDQHKNLVARAFELRLNDENAQVRRLAVKGVGFHPDDRTATSVVALLEDRDAAIRGDVYKLLARLKDARSITPVVHHLADHGEMAREAFDALAREPAYSDVISRAFETALTHQNARMKILAAEELAKWKGSGTVDALIETLPNESDGAVRRAMIATLAKLKDPRAIPPLVTRLREDREPASEALAAFGPAAEKALLGVVKATANDKEVRLAACRILKTAGTKESLSVLRGAAADPDPDIALASVEAWQKLDPDSMTPLVASIVDMQSTDAARHRAGLERLAEAKFDKTQQEEVARLLLKFVTDADESIRRPALVVLPVWATDTTVKALLKLEDEKAEQLARRHAHTALGTLKDRPNAKSFADVIVKFVDADRPEAAEALVALGPVAEPAVIEHLLYHKDSDEMITVGVNILGEIGTRNSRAIPELQKLILEQPDKFREPALRAIDAIRARPITPLRKPATTQP